MPTPEKESVSPRVHIKVAEPPLERNTSSSSGFRRALPRLQREVKFFGVLTALILCVVVGMSVFVVHSREVQLEARGSVLVTPNGQPVSTEVAEYAVHTLGEALRQGPGMLEKMTAVAFQAETPEGNAEVIMHVGRIVRIENGVTTVYGTTGDSLASNVSSSGPHDELTSATYIAPGACATGCRVLLRASEVSNRHGRQLHFVWWNPTTWFSSHGLHYAPDCEGAGGAQVAVRWEYTSCVCRFRFWNCGEGTAKHVRTCQDNSGGASFNLVYNDCQMVNGAPP